MTTWTEGTCEANGITLHYLRTGGDRPPMVLLHGLMGSGACWTPLARRLEDDFDVIMPDARGHGGSSAPPGGYRYDDMADDVLGLMAALGLARPVLLGHSMGGMTAAVVASRTAAPLDRLLLVDPTFLSPERQREVFESDVAGQHRHALALSRSELLAQAQARHPQRTSEILELQVDARLRTHPQACEVLVPPNPDYREVTRAIGVSSLLIIGDHTVVTLDMANALASTQPLLQVERIPGAGHGLPFDEPDRLAELGSSFAKAPQTSKP